MSASGLPPLPRQHWPSEQQWLPYWMAGPRSCQCHCHCQWQCRRLCQRGQAQACRSGSAAGGRSRAGPGSWAPRPWRAWPVAPNQSQPLPPLGAQHPLSPAGPAYRACPTWSRHCRLAVLAEPAAHAARAAPPARRGTFWLPPPSPGTPPAQEQPQRQVAMRAWTASSVSPGPKFGVARKTSTTRGNAGPGSNARAAQAADGWIVGRRRLCAAAPGGRWAASASPPPPPTPAAPACRACATAAARPCVCFLTAPAEAQPAGGSVQQLMRTLQPRTACTHWQHQSREGRPATRQSNLSPDPGAVQLDRLLMALHSRR